MPEYLAASSQAEPPAELVAAVERALGRKWLRASVPETGLTMAYRFLVELSGGLSVFVKAAMTDDTAAQLRNERVAIEHAPEGLAPEIFAWVDRGPDGMPVLVARALDGHWPAGHSGVDWRPGHLDAVFEALARLAATPAPAELASRTFEPDRSWRTIAANPSSFLDFDICSAAWFDAHAATLIDAEERLDRTGTAFVHGDVRSDNLCMMPNGPVFVDWGNAHAGSSIEDLATFLPVALLEGGPRPFDILPGASDWASAQAADFARRALEDENAPQWLQSIFVRLARINLDWAAASLGLPPPGDR